MANDNIDLRINAILDPHLAIKGAEDAGDKLKQALSIEVDDATIKAYQETLKEQVKSREAIREQIKATAIDVKEIKLTEEDITKQKELQAKQAQLLVDQERQQAQIADINKNRIKPLKDSNKLDTTKWGTNAKNDLKAVQDSMGVTNKELADTNKQLADIETRSKSIAFNEEAAKEGITQYKAETLKAVEVADLILNREKDLANSTKQTAATQASSMDEVTRAMEQTKTATDGYTTSVENAGNVKIDAEGFTEQTAAKVSSVAKNMDEVTQAEAQIGKGAQEAGNDVSELIKRIAELKDNIAKVEAGQPIGKDNHTATVEEYQRMNVELREAQKTLKIYRGQMEETANSTNKGGRDTRSITVAMRDLKSVANSVVKTFKQFNVLGKIGDKLKSSISSIKSNLNSAVKSLRRSLKRGFTTFTKYILGFKSLYYLVRRLRKYIVEGINNLVQYNDKVSKGVKSHNLMNDAMNDLQTSLLYLKNAWAAAFAPIVIKVMPILTGFIDYLAVAGNAVAKFVAELTGQATAYNALKVQAQDYADSLDDAGSSAKKSAKDQDKLNKSLASYDKLLVIQSKEKDDDSGSPSGGSGASDYSPKIQNMFKTITADENSFAGILGKAIADAKFEEAGAMIGKAIKDGLDNIDWDSIKKKIGELGRKLGEFLKGLFNTEGLASSVGSAAGEVVNAIGNFIDSLLRQTKDIDFGKGLADAVTGFLEATDWNLVKSNIREVISQFKDNIKSAIDNFPWARTQYELKGLATTLSSSITSALSDKEFMDSVGKGIGETINTIIDVIQGIFDGAKGKDVGGGFATALNTTLKTVDFKQIAKTVGDSLIFVFNNASSFLEQVNWDEFGTAIQTFLENVDWGSVLQGVARFIISSNNALTKLLASISNGISDTILNASPDDIAKAIEGFISGIDVGAVADAVGALLSASIKALFATPQLIIKGLGGLFKALVDAIADYFLQVSIQEGDLADPGQAISDGILNGIIQSFKAPFDWIKQYIFDPFIENFCKVWKIGSPSKVMEGYGGDIIDGLKNGIADFWNKIKQFFDPANPNSLFAKIKGVFSKKNFETIKTKLGEAWGTVTNVFSETWGKIKKFFDASDSNSIWAKLKSFFTKNYITKNVIDKIKGGWSAISSVFSNTWDKIKKFFDASNSDSIWAKLKGFFTKDYITKNIVNKVKGSWNVITDVFSGTWGKIKKYFDSSSKDSIIKKIKDAFLGQKGKVNGEDTFVGGFVGGILDSIRTLKANLRRPINAVIDMIENFINYCIHGINDLTKKLNNIKITIGSTTYGFNFPNIADIKLPHLAQGAVIPPNKEFMAVLGDQKQGTNIETPLNTMVDAFKIALAESGSTNHDPIVLQLDGRTVAQVVWNEEEKKYKQTGFGLAY